MIESERLRAAEFAAESRDLPKPSSRQYRVIFRQKRSEKRNHINACRNRPPITRELAANIDRQFSLSQTLQRATAMVAAADAAEKVWKPLMTA